MTGHDRVKAWEAWEAWKVEVGYSGGADALNPSTLGTKRAAEFLENRLGHAFEAGWEACKACKASEASEKAGDRPVER